MARAEVFTSNHLKSEDKKSLRVPKIKLEYAEYTSSLKTPRKSEKQDSKTVLPKKPKTTRKMQQGNRAFIKALKNIKGKPTEVKVDKTANKKTIVKPGHQRQHIVLLKNRVMNAEKAFKLPSPDGFHRIVVQRMKGSSAGKLDTYYLSPHGQKLRSRPDITKYLEKHGIKNLNAEIFEFQNSIPKFKVMLGFAEGLKIKKAPTASAPVKLKRVCVRLENIDHLLLKQSAGTANDATEQPPEEGKEKQPESEAPEAEDELDVDQPNWQSVQTPRRWLPQPSPYKLIYEDPEINNDCWKLFTASIIIYYWKLNSFVHRYVSSINKGKDFILS
jgi:Methyl-CpG binding domain